MCGICLAHLLIPATALCALCKWLYSAPLWYAYKHPVCGAPCCSLGSMTWQFRTTPRPWKLTPPTALLTTTAASPRTAWGILRVQLLTSHQPYPWTQATLTFTTTGASHYASRCAIRLLRCCTSVLRCLGGQGAWGSFPPAGVLLVWQAACCVDLCLADPSYQADVLAHVALCAVASAGSL